MTMEICRYCQAINNGEEPRCDNYPTGWCPVGWKPEENEEEDSGTSPVTASGEIVAGDRSKERAAMNIGKRMIAERQREVAVSLKALRLMQEHHGNPYFSFKCVPLEEEREWYAKAEKLIPQIEAV